MGEHIQLGLARKIPVTAVGTQGSESVDAQDRLQYSLHIRERQMLCEVQRLFASSSVWLVVAKVHIVKTRLEVFFTSDAIEFWLPLKLSGISDTWSILRLQRHSEGTERYLRILCFSFRAFIGIHP